MFRARSLVEVRSICRCYCCFSFQRFSDEHGTFWTRGKLIWSSLPSQREIERIHRREQSRSWFGKLSRSELNYYVIKPYLFCAWLLICNLLCKCTSTEAQMKPQWPYSKQFCSGLLSGVIRLCYMEDCKVSKFLVMRAFFTFIFYSSCTWNCDNPPSILLHT